jgi:hypothetical protein
MPIKNSVAAVSALLLTLCLLVMPAHAQGQPQSQTLTPQQQQMLQQRFQQQQQIQQMYNFTPAQLKQQQDLNTKANAKIKLIAANSSLSISAKADKIAAVLDGLTASIRASCTPEQRKTYDNLKKKSQQNDPNHYSTRKRVLIQLISEKYTNSLKLIALDKKTSSDIRAHKIYALIKNQNAEILPILSRSEQAKLKAQDAKLSPATTIPKIKQQLDDHDKTGH